MFGPFGTLHLLGCRFTRRLRWALARLVRAIAIGLLMVEGALLVRSLARAQELALGRLSAELRLTRFAIAPTAATATAPAPSTTFTACGTVLGRTAIGIHFWIRTRLEHRGGRRGSCHG